MNKLITSIVTLCAVVLICSPAFAQETEKAWNFSLTPFYFWGTAIDGTQTVKGQKADVDVSFSDIFDNLEGILTFHFEGIHKQKIGFFVDFSWLKLGVDGSIDPGVMFDVDYTGIYAELGGFYRIRKGSNDFDFLGGIRYTDMDVELELGSLPEFQGDQNWVDPILGGRWTRHLNNQWKLSLRGEFGGFGVGSDFTWNTVGLVFYRPWKHVGIVGGYRAMYQDYEDGSGSELFQYDATMHGPMFGTTIYF